MLTHAALDIGRDAGVETVIVAAQDVEEVRGHMISIDGCGYGREKPGIAPGLVVRTSTEGVAYAGFV